MFKSRISCTTYHLYFPTADSQLKLLSFQGSTTSDIENVATYIYLTTSFSFDSLLFLQLLYTDVLSHMPNLKKLFIHCATVNNHSLPRLIDLIWASPCLEEFTFLVGYTLLWPHLCAVFPSLFFFFFNICNHISCNCR